MSDILFYPEEDRSFKEVKLPSCKILIVDDEKEIHKVTKLVLEDFTFEGNNLEFISAYSAKEAKKILNEDDDIAIILLDVVMEEDDSGLKLARYIREELKNRILQIILRTGQAGEAPEKEIIKNYEINDYKAKTELTFEKLYTTIMASLRSYQTLKELKETRATKERMESELEVAKKIQTSMLPGDLHPFADKDEINISAKMEPAYEVGGDFYDYFFIDDNKFCFVIGDVSGKGIPAALFMVIAKTLIKHEALKNISPEEIFYNVNNAICKDNKELLFVTAFIGILDLKTGKVEFVNAGHTPPLIWRERDKRTEYLESEGNFILGGMDNFEYNMEEANIYSGDVILLYTDGVTEAKSKNNEQYSILRLEKLFSKIGHEDVYQIEKIIKEDVDQFTRGSSKADDVTILTLEFN